MTARLDSLLDKNGGAMPGAPLGLLPSARAQRTPANAALTCGEVTMDWRTFDGRANRRARQLTGLGVGRDDRALVGLPNGFDYYEMVFALWKLGATPCQISPKLTPPELAAIVRLAEPKLIIGDAAYDGALGVLRSDQAPDPSLPADPLPAAVAGNWKIATSGGSTGTPKLVVDPNPSIWGPDKGFTERRSQDVIVNPAPLYHTASFNAMLLGLADGCHIVEMGRFDPVRYLELMQRHRVTYAYLVPTMMSRIAKLPAEQRAQFDLSSVRVLFHSAAPCPEWVKQLWIDWLGPDAVWELYGGAERIGGALINGREWLTHRGSVGRVRKGADLAILGPDGEPLPPGEVGEIYFRNHGGPFSTYRYIGAEPRTRGDWHSLGDMGYVDAEGYLFIADRRVDLIVSGGANIYPAEVEAALSAIPHVLSSAVIGLPDPDLGQRVHAIVEVPANMLPEISEKALLDLLAARLVRYKLPRSIEFTTEPLRDEAGKVRRSALRDERLALMPSGAQRHVQTGEVQ